MAQHSQKRIILGLALFSHNQQSMIWVDYFLLSLIPLDIWIWKSYTGWPPPPKKKKKKKKKRNSRFSGLCSYQQLSFFSLLERASFPHYNNTNIIKFGWELFILWVIFNGLSFSGFAQFPEFRGTINDSFGSPYIERVLCSVTRVLPNKD